MEFSLFFGMMCRYKDTDRHIFIFRGGRGEAEADGVQKGILVEGIYIDGGVFSKFASETASESCPRVLWSVDLHSGGEQ